MNADIYGKFMNDNNIKIKQILLMRHANQKLAT